MNTRSTIAGSLYIFGFTRLTRLPDCKATNVAKWSGLQPSFKLQGECTFNKIGYLMLVHSIQRYYMCIHISFIELITKAIFVLISLLSILIFFIFIKFWQNIYLCGSTGIPTHYMYVYAYRPKPYTTE